MAQTPDNSLEGRIAALESAQRAAQTSSAVVGSAVAAVNPAQVALTGVANAGPGSAGWTYDGPSVDLFAVGRMRVDLAARLEVHGNKASVYAGYRVQGPAADLAALGAAPVLQAPDITRAIEFQDPDGSGISRLAGMGVHDVVTGLASGYYRVIMAFFLAYSGTTNQPYGNITNRRLSVTIY
jgi:hypothetical protein